MSTAGPSTEKRLACASIASARPVSSATVSPFARSATRKLASLTGETSPDMTWSMAHAVRSASRSFPATSSVSRPGQVSPAPVESLVVEAAGCGVAVTGGPSAGRSPGRLPRAGGAQQVGDGALEGDRVERPGHRVVGERPRC
ncbi:Uncharacterised protein [Mycobacteroides abscessus]|nr:Uncharacterised protein [Mycobacteroides abscessus]